MKYLFFDTETTGLPRSYRAPVWRLDNWPRAIQLGWVLTDSQGKELEYGCRTIRAGRYRFDSQAIELHGITPEWTEREGIPVKLVLREFCELLKQADVVVAHNIQFDVMILRAEFLRSWRRNHFRGRALRCTMRESTEFCGLTRPNEHDDCDSPQAERKSAMPRLKWPSLQELHSILFNEPVDEHHNALADSQACARCFWELKRAGVV